MWRGRKSEVRLSVGHCTTERKSACNSPDRDSAILPQTPVHVKPMFLPRSASLCLGLSLEITVCDFKCDWRPSQPGSPAPYLLIAVEHLVCMHLRVDVQNLAVAVRVVCLEELA